jgi:hypothetical protein
MLDLKFTHVYMQLVELSKNGQLVWKPHSASEFPTLDPDAVLSAVYKARYKDRNIIIYQQRVSFNRSVVQSEPACDFVDDDNKKTGEMPRAQGIADLYRQAFLQNRPAHFVELDKVVAALSEMTSGSKIQWVREDAKGFPELEPDVLTSAVYHLEYRGRRFITFREMSAGATKSPANRVDQPALWIVGADGRKLKDLRDAEGIEALNKTVMAKTGGGSPEFDKLDAVVDQLVASTIGQVVAAIKAEKARQAAKAAAQAESQEVPQAAS